MTTKSDLKDKTPSSLCIACNLCCDGSVFSSVPVTEAERDRLATAVDFVTEGDHVRIPLPCRQLGADGTCGCYALRPKVCRNFDCKLLKRREKNVVDHDTATEIVSEVKAVRDRAAQLIREALGADFEQDDRDTVTTLYNRMVNHWNAKRPGMSRYRVKRALVHYAAFEDLISLHIRTKRSRVTPSTPRLPIEKQPSQ